MSREVFQPGESREVEKIGERALTPKEEMDALILGLKPEDVADMTPTELREFADWYATVDRKHLGV